MTTLGNLGLGILHINFKMDWSSEVGWIIMYCYLHLCLLSAIDIDGVRQIEHEQACGHIHLSASHDILIAAMHSESPYMTCEIIGRIEGKLTITSLKA
jgi:hypothetical protein